MATVYENDFDYPVEANRYRLISAYTCPFGHRTTIVRRLMKLNDVISEGLTNSNKTTEYWSFSEQEGGKEAVLGAEDITEVYHNTDPDYNGPYSVPILVDTETGNVVNQESMDIARDLATRFKEIAPDDAPDLYPEALRDDIDEAMDYYAENVLMAMEHASGATDQAVYDEAYDTLFNTFEKLDEFFEDHQFLVNDQLTLADVILYTPLARFDAAFALTGKLNKARLTDYPNLWRYARRLYQMPAFKDSTDFHEIQKGFFTGKTGKRLFRSEVIPKGPDFFIWDEPVED